MWKSERGNNNIFAGGAEGGGAMWVCYIKLGSHTGQRIRPNTIDRRRAVQEERLNNGDKERHTLTQQPPVKTTSAAELPSQGNTIFQNAIKLVEEKKGNDRSMFIGCSISPQLSINTSSHPTERVF